MTQVLYGAKGGNAASDLYTIDPVTAATTIIGPTGIALTGLAFHPGTGVLYGATSELSPGGTRRSLYTIDPTTGAATLIGSGGAVGDIAFDSGGTLYGLSFTAGNKLVSIDLSTGAFTPIGSAVGSISGGGISVDSTDVAFTTFFGTPQHLTNIDLATAALSDIFAISGITTENGSALAFDEADVLWACFLNSGTASLWTVTTGPFPAATLIGSLPSKFDAIAWGPSSSPATPCDPDFGWAAQTTSVDQFGYRCCWADGPALFVQVGQQLSPTDTIATSPTGLTGSWTGRGNPFSNPYANGVCWSNGHSLICAVSLDQAATSPTGVAWTAHSLGDLNAVSVAAGAGKFVAVGNGTYSIQTSPDGATWTGVASDLDDGSASGVCFSSNLGLWLVGGSNADGSITLLSSPDAVTWTAVTNPLGTATGQVLDVCWWPDLGLFIACGISFTDDNITLMTSPDGTSGSWTVRANPFDGHSFDQSPNVVGIVGDFAIVGGQYLGASAVIRSADGITWCEDISPFG